jgi:hypothetical protein
MTQQDKQKWIRPELTILVRARPEEAVLGWCKTNYQGGAGPHQSQCAAIDSIKNPLSDCDPFACSGYIAS